MRRPLVLLWLCAPLLAALPARAQDFAQGVVTGRLDSISPKAAVVQGVAALLDEGTLLRGLDGKGRVVALGPRDFLAGTVATLFLEEGGDGPRALALLRGPAFFLHGTVTARREGKGGLLTQLTLDGRWRIRVAEAETAWGPDSGSPEEESGDAAVEEGDEVFLVGLAQGGSLAAVFVKVVAAGGGEAGDDEGPVVARFGRERTGRPKPESLAERSVESGVPAPVGQMPERQAGRGRVVLGCTSSAPHREA